MMNEDQVLQFWDDQKIFQKSIDARSNNERFVFYDGPPFATGLPHYGHMLASTIKDVIPRFWTMNGKRIERVWGWDCHGLPIENIIELELALKSRKEIIEYGVAKFNASCRARVLEYAGEWKKIIRRMARWVDMEHAYTTMDLSYMESVWWVFKTLWDNGLIYEGRKSMHICPRCETVLSNFEVTQGYKDISDVAVYPLFPLTSGKHTGSSLVAWTTTTWTLPGNVLLAVHPDHVYVSAAATINGSPRVVILAKDRLKDVEHDLGIALPVTQEFPAHELIGSTYTPLFPIFGHHENAFRVVSADFVTLSDGTGVVHIAPGFGEDDMRLGAQQQVEPVMHVEMNGQFVLPVVEWFATQGIDLAAAQAKPKDDHRSTDQTIAQYLEMSGKLLGRNAITHSYPHCWRCETPLLNYSATSWFVRVTERKDRMVELNANDITWVPEHFRDGRFGKWLEGARDWAISRSRYWGTPLPIWRAQDGSILCMGSRKELEELSGETINDLHKDRVDDIVIQRDGKTYRRIDEVLDCWFESGSMPYAQLHYPFEHANDFTANFPAEFIGEGQDQTRGWFYTLHVLSTALNDSVAFKHVIVNGIVLAEDGKKMSKRLKNYPEPQKIIERYGADAMRMYLCLSPAMEAENLNFSEKGVDEVYKKVSLLAGNVLKFWELYASTINNPAPYEAPASTNVLDQWIVAKTEQLLKSVHDGLSSYHIPAGTRPIVEFIQDLSTWYVRRSRDRCKAGGDDGQQAILTLGWVLRLLSISLAPCMPMLAEGIYQSLFDNKKESVHLEDWPMIRDEELKRLGDGEILSAMDSTRRFASIAHQKRAEAGIKVRQPLASLTIKIGNLDDDYKQILCDEVNVKHVILDPNLSVDAVLNTEVSANLKQEGLVRELVRLINAARKSAGLTINDRVRVHLRSTLSLLPPLIAHYGDELKHATLSSDIQLTAEAAQTSILLEGTPIDIELKKQ
ncbi:isoleucine--tRNA ligase [Candidatus Uhrbacteria bacterium]|nr:isoleucine--tRNA ligase [Candidatus Uhrbacteria bacterium]